jgi:uncharacterized protein YqhQ
MWDSENQRLALKACTPVGYFLLEVADGIGFLGLFLFVAMPVFLVYRAIVHHFSWHLCWLLLVSIVIGIIGRVIWEISWRIAAKKQFRYDSEHRVASWIEAGQMRVFPSSTQA